MTAEPPPIVGVRRSFVEAHGVRFHVTEAGPADGRPVLALHGWPQHHWEYRDLLADPPPGLRIIAPDLPGYGWSGPPPHKWAKADVAKDVLALMDALGLDRVLLVAHDWGAYVGYLMVLEEPARFGGFLPMNINHPWVSPGAALPHLWRLSYQLPLATFGVPFQRYTPLVNFFLRVGSEMNREDAQVFAERFRDPVCARAGRDTYRTFLLRELPAGARQPEKRRATVPIRVLYGGRDTVVRPSMVAPESAKADDYTLETVDATHFVVDERPDLVRKKLIELAEETAHS
ncbi:alpha/beta fold hydrolase [Mycobacterium sp. 1274761.0]|uniref:alpha/beta fold hydrolase n=1 Tax=Mycobacterium sp. 1274761.0 TaxID=1834077 RepID=UPI0007FF8D34|nr:alpha/beta hydrolase [Mycobacterium sp. 1274761.0]OBK80103.1 alpha/beta hydrolase [Mycobacterium sp. 1274761.0]